MKSATRFLPGSLETLGGALLALAVLAIPTQYNFADDPPSWTQDCGSLCTQLQVFNPYDPFDPEVSVDFATCMNQCVTNGASGGWCYLHSYNCGMYWCALVGSSCIQIGMPGQYQCGCRIVF